MPAPNVPNLRCVRTVFDSSAGRRRQGVEVDASRSDMSRGGTSASTGLSAPLRTMLLLPLIVHVPERADLFNGPKSI